MQFTNLKFSIEETKAMTEQEFFLLKNSAILKIIRLYGEIEKDLKREVSDLSLDFTGLNISSGKIFRGENYRLFPYIILDYPRLFSPESIFAFRTMFWWGHEFSFTLHLQGEALERYRFNLSKNLESLTGKDIYYCVNDTPWQYNFEQENYILLDSIKNMLEVNHRPFIKLSKRIPVQQHGNVQHLCIETFRLFMKAIL
jgi:hypothetical protein